MMSLRVPRFWRIAVIAVLGALPVALIVIGGGAEAQLAAKKDTSRQGPINELPAEEQDAARRKVMDDMAAKQPAFLDDFWESGQDIHELPVFELSPQVLGTSGLADAIAKSAVIVRGVVVDQGRGDNGSGGVLSTLKIANILSGTVGVSGETLSVHQPGGPFLNGSTPVLMQWSSDPFLRIGHEYILFLSPCETTLASHAYCMTASPQQIEVVDGRVRSTIEGTWTDSFNGETVETFETMVSTERLGGG